MESFLPFSFASKDLPFRILELIDHDTRRKVIGNPLLAKPNRWLCLVGRSKKPL